MGDLPTDSLRLYSNSHGVILHLVVAAAAQWTEVHSETPQYTRVCLILVEYRIRAFVPAFQTRHQSGHGLAYTAQCIGGEANVAFQASHAS
jgi:hypothetical protein